MSASEDDAVRVEVLGRLDDEEIRRVALLVEHATEADGVRPLSEHVSLHLRHGGDAPARNLLAYVGDGADRDRLAGYAHLDATDAVEGASAELVVDPACRRRGVASTLLAHLVAESPDGRLRLWSHGDHADARALAAARGFSRARTLLQLRRSLFAPLPAAAVPDGVAVRTFVAGADDAAWLDLNGRAFAGHPEQAHWTLNDLHRRMAEPWFDPAGFFLAERDGRLVGFHWTKVHGGGTGHGAPGRGDPGGHSDPGGHGHGGQPEGPHTHENHGHEPIGEVYVVGVDPAEQGRGLGRALTLVGLQHLRGLDLAAAMLYVEADNAPAIRLYTALGFTHWVTDVQFSR